MGVVYKYGPQACIEYFLANRTLRFAAASAQNDINEFIPNFGDHLNYLIQKTVSDLHEECMAPGSNLPKQTKAQIFSQLFGDSEHGDAMRLGLVVGLLNTVGVKYGRAGILSLTRNREDWLMWAHYAERGAGICVGFDETAPIFASSSFGGTQVTGVNSVRYSNERPTVDGRQEAERFVEAALTKSKHWEYEQEVRCIRDFDAAGDSWLLGFDPSNVNQIILGPRIPKPSALRCIELHEQFFPHAQLLWALPDLTEYKMQFYRVPKRELLDIAVYRDSQKDFDGLAPFGKA